MIELNVTGTLPDEMDDISTVRVFYKNNIFVDVVSFHTDEFELELKFLFKCFIRCYMEKIGILKNDIIDRERADELSLTRNEDILDDCLKESRGKMKIHSLLLLEMQYNLF